MWRLLGLETYDAATNMAIDEAVLRSRIEGKSPNTVRFYRWNPSAVSIGRFQNVHTEVNLENCEKDGVDVVRRITGGGAVYHDSQNEITYSVVVGRNDLGVTDVTTAYNRICNGLTSTLKILGMRADFNPGDPKNCPNITVNGRKISGSSQSVKSGVVLQHGTLLLNVDLEKMFTYLRVPWAKTCMEIVNVAQRKITSLKEELGAEISTDRAYAALITGFEEAMELDLSEGELTPDEKRVTEKLCRKKFANAEWNFLGAQTPEPYKL
jgi:lipoate-protein ligase A